MDRAVASTWVNTEMFAPFAVWTERMDEDSVIAPSLLNPLGAELVASGVPARRRFELD